jgi:ATP-binding cassette, subfamily B, bacterial
MTSPSPSRASTIRSLARLYPFARPAMRRLIVGAIAAMLSSLVALVIPQVLRVIVDGPLQSGDGAQLVPVVAIVLVLGALEAGLFALRRFFALQPTTHIEARLRNAFYAKLQDLPVSFHDRWASGQLLSRMMSDLGLIRRWFSFGLILLVVNVLTVLAGLVFLISISWVLGVVFVVCSAPLWIFSYRFEARYSEVSRLSQDQSGDLATAVEESVHGIRVLKAFGRGRHALDNFAVRAEQLRQTEISKARAIGGIWLWIVLVPDVTFAIGLFTGVWLAVMGDITVGSLVAFFATATVLRFPVDSIGFLLSMTFDARTAADRYFEVMDSMNTIVDPDEARSITDPRGRLVFENVHFRYQDAPADQADLINGIDLAIEPGETMAVVGLTGSGKTTLTALSTRLYDVTGGRVTLDGIDVRDLSREQLRTHIAMAFEDATLFSATVRENVLMGKPDAGEDELASALEIAQAGFVYDLPAGLDTMIGEEGLSLSGGQRQRLALARAVAAAPDVLVLDDPLSALDVDTEALVEAALRQVLASTTALVVAHRPSTVALADRVALLENGRVTAVGTHSHLLATSEHYRHVISSLDPEGDAVERTVNA